MSGVDMILAERLRQIKEEGFLPQHCGRFSQDGAV